MAFVVTSDCVKCKYTDCVEVCPVDAFYELDQMLVIHADECIDCAMCEPECPVGAIKSPDEVPSGEEAMVEFNYNQAEQAPGIWERKDPLPNADDYDPAYGRGEKRQWLRDSYGVNI